MEFELKVDLTGDGVAGVSINSELFNKEQDASGNWVMNSNDRRWLYATSGGTLLSSTPSPLAATSVAPIEPM